MRVRWPKPRPIIREVDPAPFEPPSLADYRADRLREERDAALDRIDELQQAVADFARGLTTKDELVEIAKP